LVVVATVAFLTLNELKDLPSEDEAVDELLAATLGDINKKCTR